MKSYKCYFVFWRDQPEYSQNIIALSASSARYSFYKLSEVDLGYGECFAAISSISLGKAKPNHFFGDKEQFVKVIGMRDISFATMGMRIDVSGKKGVIVGGNSSANLNVLFDGQHYVANCHPHWETTYYDEDGNVIRNYKKALELALI